MSIKAITSFVQKAGMLLATPIEVGDFKGKKWSNYNLNPFRSLADFDLKKCQWKTVEPTPALKKISGTADQILNRTQNLNIVPDPAPVSPPSEVPPAARPFNPAEVSDPIDHQPLASTTEDWEKVLEKDQKELSERLTRFTAFFQMRAACGKVDRDSTQILKLVADSFTSSQTPLQLFTAVYKPTWFQWIKAGLISFFCLKTSLVSNTIKAYLGVIVKDIQGQLTSKDSDPTRAQFFRKFIGETTEFLNVWNGAAREFKDLVAPTGDLNTYRKAAITKHYNNLKELCEDFSATIVEKHSPHISFFSKNWKNLPVVGYFFSGVESVANWLIHKYMKSSVLPQTLVSTIENAYEVTDPSNLPFAFEITKFFTEQLRDLNKELDSDTETVAPKAPPGTEGLFDLIKVLLLTLEIQPFSDREELKRKFQEIDKQKSTDEMQDAIGQGILLGGHILFDTFNNANKAGELLSNLLKLALNPFSGEAYKTQAQWIEEYDREKNNLHTETKIAVGKLIDKAVHEKVYGTGEADKTAAEKLFKKQKEAAKSTFSKLTELANQMKEKVEQSAAHPISSNSIQPKVATAAGLLKTYSDKELQDSEQTPVDRAGQNAIRRALNPVYHQTEELSTQLDKLQKLDRRHTVYTDIEQKLDRMQGRFQGILDQLPFPQTLQISELDLIQKEIEAIQAHIKSAYEEKDPLLIAYLKQKVQFLTDFVPPLIADQAVLENLEQLLPVSDPKEPKVGLIHYFTRRAASPHLKPSQCLSQIDQLLKHLPDQEASQALRKLLGTGANITPEKWDEITRRIEEMRTIHTANKEIKIGKIQTALVDVVPSITQMIDSYKQKNSKNHAELKNEVARFIQKTTQLNTEAEQLETNSPIRVSGLGTGANVVATSLATAASAVASTYFGSPLFMLGSLAAVPDLIGYGPGKALKAWAEWNYAPQYKDKVMKYFESARELILLPHVYHAAVTRTMKAWSVSRGPTWIQRARNAFR